VPVKVLDKELADRGGRRVGFIKIDMEGAEYCVFQGARELLRRDRPVILSEVFDAQLRAISGVDAVAYVEFLTGFGYRCVALDEGGPVDVADPAAFFPDAIRRRAVWNVAFLPV
jgi:hypothetical protein